MTKKIRSALISVYHKDGLDKIIPLLVELEIVLYSTGGTQKLLESYGAKVNSVEKLTSYPSILDGRVKTLHPKVFGGILARREEDHQKELRDFEIPELDLVVVDLYPFEQTLSMTDDETEIIEKIDIGGISLIRAAAKNYRDVVVIPSKSQYGDLYRILGEQVGLSNLSERKELALRAFEISSHYDTAIREYFNRGLKKSNQIDLSIKGGQVLRYGENPHQDAIFYGDLLDQFEVLNGKALSYNNLVDIDSAVELMRDFGGQEVTFAILKHTNSCGVAIRETTLDAFKSALAGDPISAFGGILICNATIDLATAEEIDKQFYEVLIAPEFDNDALAYLSKKKNRIILKSRPVDPPAKKIKSILNGVIEQTRDDKIEKGADLVLKTTRKLKEFETKELLFANILAKHLKSNTIVLTKDHQLVGMGCGQTSRVDACIQAIEKAKRLNFDLNGAVMASDAFFPFPDCVELAHNEGIKCVIQPGGSRNDHLSIEFCDNNDISMVFTGTRHFKH